MTGRPDGWMPMYWGDYFGDTRGLTTLEHGAYLLLIGCYWRRGKPLPNDELFLARAAGVGLKRWRKLSPKISQHFILSDSEWKHKRIESEILKSCQAYERHSAAAMRRWSQAYATTATAIKKEPEREPAGAITLSKGWRPGPAIFQWAALQCIPDDTLEAEIEHFRSHYLSKGETRSDWDEALKAWLIKGKRFRQQARNGHDRPKPQRGGTEAIREGIARAYRERNTDSPGPAAEGRPENGGGQTGTDG